MAEHTYIEIPIGHGLSFLESLALLTRTMMGEFDVPNDNKEQYLFSLFYNMLDLLRHASLCNLKLSCVGEFVLVRLVAFLS